MVAGRKMLVFGDKELTEMQELVDQGVTSYRMISNYFGISHNTFNELRKRQPEIDVIYRKGKTKRGRKLKNYMDELIEKADKAKQYGAAINGCRFLLENEFPYDYNTGFATTAEQAVSRGITEAERLAIERQIQKRVSSEVNKQLSEGKIVNGDSINISRVTKSQ